ncbi:uncharacterized protein VTP21DRAFT_6051 [Calcarisporiella thermophila]|uniref:uncharacterized protein n=1 Tax=Calcarisporiella thermophila TaxID=911321 RepID=UPI0037428022
MAQKSEETLSVPDLEKADDKQLHPQDLPPDGGRGWAVVVSGFIVNLVVFGQSTIFGVYQEEYTKVYPETPILQITFIGGLNLGLIFLLGPLVAPIVSKIGYRIPMLFGSVVLSLGLALASLASQIWHLFLTQAALFGIGSSFLFLSSIGLVPQWFNKRRGLAVGICTAGSGVGGIVLAPFQRYLISRLGMAWCMRVMAFVFLGLCLIATLLARPRISAAQRKQANKSFDLSLLRLPGFLSFIAFSFMNMFGYSQSFFFLPTYATSIGLTPEDGALFVGLMCGMNAISRILCGFLGDRLGRINMQFIFVFLSGLTCLFIWNFAKSYGAMLAFSLLNGVTGGAFWGLTPTVVAEIVGIDKIGSGLSIAYLSIVIPFVFGGPVSAALLQSTNPPSYVPLITFTGLALSVGSLFLIHTKLWKNPNILAKV